MFACVLDVVLLVVLFFFHPSSFVVFVCGLTRKKRFKMMMMMMMMLFAQDAQYAERCGAHKVKRDERKWTKRFKGRQGEGAAAVRNRQLFSSLDLDEECGGDTVRRAGCTVESVVTALEAMGEGFLFFFFLFLVAVCLPIALEHLARMPCPCLIMYTDLEEEAEKPSFCIKG